MKVDSKKERGTLDGGKTERVPQHDIHSDFQALNFVGPRREAKMDPIRTMWDSLIQTSPDMKGLVGNAKLVGKLIKYNDQHEKIFHFLTKRAHSPSMSSQGSLKVNCRLCS